MKNMNSQMPSDNVMVHNKLKNASDSSESNTKGSLQDGGPQQNMNLDRTGIESIRVFEGPNSDHNSLPPHSSPTPNMPEENFSKMNDLPSTQMSNYGSGYIRANFNMNDQQHGGLPNTTCSTSGVDFPPQSPPYSQFVPANIRPNCPPNSSMTRGQSIQNRPGIGGNQMGVITTSYASQQQRQFMSGPSIQQQGGPTPTLNQLLQNPNSSQRYQSGYGDYPMNQPKSDIESTGGNQGYGQSGWNQPRPINPYPPHSGTQPSRSQGPYDSNRRPLSGYVSHLGMYQNQPQLSPNSIRYPIGQSRLPSFQQTASSQLCPNSNADKPSSADERTTSGGEQPYQGSGDSNQQPSSNNSQDGGGSDDLNSDSNSTGTISRPTPTPTPTSTPGPQQQSQSHSGGTQRPIPSPAGSTGSRSGTPSCITGYPMQPQSMMPPPVGQNQMGYPQSVPNKLGLNMMSVGPLGNYNNQYPSQPSGNFRGGPGMGMYNQTNSFNGSASMPLSQFGNNANSPMGRNLNYGGSLYPAGATPNSVVNSQYSNYGAAANMPLGHCAPPGASVPPSHGTPSTATSAPHGVPQASPGGPQGEPNAQLAQTTVLQSHINNSSSNNANQRTPTPTDNGQNLPGGTNSSSQSSGKQSPGPKGAQAAAQAAAHAAMMAAANQSANMPHGGRTRSPSGGSSSMPPSSQTPPASQQSTPQRQLSSQQQPVPAQQIPPGSSQQLQHPDPQVSSVPPQPPGQGSHHGVQIGPNGSTTISHQRMYGPGNYTSQYNMNQLPSSDSGVNNLPPYDNTMDSIVSGPPPYGQLGQSAGLIGLNSSQMPNRYGLPSLNEMTTMHGTGMSGGCVSVTPNISQPGITNSITPHTVSSNNSMPLCDMNNGIPPNAMAPTSSHMGDTSGVTPHGMSSQNDPVAMNGPNSAPCKPGTPTPQDGKLSDVDVKPILSSTTAGDTSTTVTQSITAPLTNAMESKPPLMCIPTTRVMGPPPPRAYIQPSQIDSSSQDSHSSSQDSDSEKVKVKAEIKQETSSPGTSMHDELENISSPSWPGTPKSDIKTNDKSEKGIFGDVFQKQLDFSGEPERRPFLEKLFTFMEERSSAITQNPTISKQAIDLYKLYSLVKEKGGMVEVTKGKKWRDVSGALSIGNSSSAGFTLRKNYAKYIFPLECKFDRGDVDPVPILASLETSSKKDSKKNQQASQAQQQIQDLFRGPPGQQPFNAFGPNMRHPQIGGNPDMHGPMMPPNVSMMPNSMHYDQSGVSPSNNLMSNNNPSTLGPGNNSMPNNVMQGGQGNMSMGNQLGPQSRSVGNNDSVSVQNPFADTPPSQYQRPGVGQPLPQYSSGIQQANTTMSSSFGNYGSRGMAGFQGNSNHQNTFQDVNRVGNQRSGDSFGSGSESFSQTNMGQNQQMSNSPSGSGPFSQFGNRMGPNMGRQSPFNQQQQSPQSQSSPMPPADSQLSQQSLGESSSSETTQVRQPTPQPTQSKSTPPQLHSTDSNSSTGSSGMRPPSTPSNNQEPQHSPQPSLFPGSYGNNQHQSMSPSHEHTNQMPSQPPISSHGNQIPPGGHNSQQQQPGGYPAQPYRSERGYPGYHGPPGSGPYSGQKIPGQQYPGHQPYTTQKSYSEMTSREGYMTPDMRPRDASWSPGPSQRYPQQTGAPSFPNRQLAPGIAPPSGNYPSTFNRILPSHAPMSPHRHEKSGFYAPQPKLQKSSSVPPGPVPGKKEIVFPADCVESAQPHLVKRRRLRHKDIGQIQAWRLMMALKSGLLVESTWALDTLSVLLFDDSTVAWFGLQHMPGLVEVLMDHYRRCLVKIFDGDFEELEISSERKKELDIEHPDTSLMEVDEEDEEIVLEREEEESEPENEEENVAKEPVDEEEEKEKVEEEKVVLKRIRRRSWKISSKLPTPDKLTEPSNYTLKTIDGKIVKLEEESPDEWKLKEKHWDIYQGYDSSTFDWQLGRGDSTGHILTHLESRDSTTFLRQCFFSGKTGEKCSPSKCPDECCTSDSTTVISKEEVIVTFTNNSTAKPVSLPQDLCVNSDKSKCDSCQGFYVKANSMCKENEHAISFIKQEPVDYDKNVVLRSENMEFYKSNSKMETTINVLDIKQELPSEDKRDCDFGNDVEQSFERGDQDLTIIYNGRQLDQLKRKWNEVGLEGEAYQHDEHPFMILPEAMQEVASRCVCVSNILRSLSFIPTNDNELAKHSGLMLVLGRLLLLHHTHPARNPDQHKFDREVELDSSETDEDNIKEWWWETLDALRENTLVTLANISGQVHLIDYAEEICLPILDGLLHWAVCPAAYAQDPMPTMSSHSVLSPQRLVLESLCKLCITDSNVDLLLATPPFSRVVQLLSNLIKLIADRNDQVMREFAIVLLSSLVQGEHCASRAIALHHPSISLLIDFIESAEHQAMQIANTHAHGISRLQENPEMMGTSLDMLRRTAITLRALAEVPENRNLFQHHQHRLLHLVMSQILDQRVAAILSEVLYYCAQQS